MKIPTVTSYSSIRLRAYPRHARCAAAASGASLPGGGVDYTGSGEYLEIGRPRRLVFTFAMLQFSPNSAPLTVEFAPSGDGCIMTFTQEGVDTADELGQLPPGAESESEKGWSLMFDGLAAALG